MVDSLERPQKPNEPSLQEKMISLYSEGASDVEVAASLGLPKARFMEMYEENTGFQKVVDVGRTMSEAWWNQVARRNLLSKGWQGSTWAFNMKNRYNWMDKMDAGGRDDATPLNVDELTTELHNTVKRIESLNPAMARKIMEGGEDG